MYMSKCSFLPCDLNWLLLTFTSNIAPPAYISQFLRQFATEEALKNQYTRRRLKNIGLHKDMKAGRDLKKNKILVKALFLNYTLVT